MSPREDLVKIYNAAIKAVDPGEAVKKNLRLNGDSLILMEESREAAVYDLREYEHVYVVGSGKATSPMAKAVEDMLGKRLTGGVICVKYGYTTDLSVIKTIEAAHPVPDEEGVRGAREILDLAATAGENDLIISLISGGGSSLLPLPPETITLEEKKATTSLLLKSGASIHEINAVRKHLSRIKGGNLARAAFPATVINLMISDVVGDYMDVIASGPFVPDNSTFNDALNILRKYQLTEKIPLSVEAHIRSGASGRIEENPLGGSAIFTRVKNSIVASNIVALKAARDCASGLGYNTCILSSLIEGDTADAARWHSRIAMEVMASSNPVPEPACILSGGETTVVVTGSGRGGRNMEFALHAASLIKGMDRVIMASIGTDGSDGPTDAAGAVADGKTVERAWDLEMNIDDYISNNDSYTFFRDLGDLIKTGPTNTNVMDVRIILVT